jgi:hypothetical protein
VCRIGLCGQMTCLVRVYECVRVYSCTCACCSVQTCVHTDVDLHMRCIVCVCRVPCRNVSSDTCVHTAAAFCILVHPVAHTHDPSLFPMGCHKRMWQSLWAWGMLDWGQKSPLPMLLRGAEPLLAERGQLMQGVVSDPMRRGPGHSSAGTASTPRFLDQLLASSPANQKSIWMGTSRLAFEARSMSFACSVR